MRRASHPPIRLKFDVFEKLDILLERPKCLIIAGEHHLILDVADRSRV